MTINNRFNRQYEVVIGRVPFTDLAEWNDFYLDETLLEQLKSRSRDGSDTSGGILSRIQTEGFKINQNQMKAEVVHSSNATQGVASLVVYNLDQRVISFMNTTNNIVFININAGYESDKSLSTIFLGEVVSVKTELEKGSDQLVTIFTLKDSLTTVRKTDITKEFRDRAIGVEKRDVLSYLIDCWEAVGIPLGYLSTGTLEDPSSFPEGRQIVSKSYLVSGNLKDAMDDFMEVYLYDFSWVIFAGQLYIWRTNFYFPDDVELQVGFDVEVNRYTINNNQIIGKPSVTTVNQANTLIPVDQNGTEQDRPKSGIVIEVLLDGRIIPSSLIEVENLEGNRGIYVVETVKHTLNYIGDRVGGGSNAGKWITEIKANVVGYKESTGTGDGNG